MINNKFATTYMETGAIAGLPDSHFIGGAWVAGNSGQKMQSYDPALAEAFGEDALGTATDMDNAEHLAFLESLDSGKTLAEAEGDAANSARLFEYHAGAADKLDGHSVNLGAAHTAFTV